MTGITAQQALDCLRSTDLIGIGMEADAVRRRLHPEGVVTYSIECTIPLPANLAQLAVQAADLGASSILLDAPRASLADLQLAVRTIASASPELSIAANSSADPAALAAAGLHRLAGGPSILGPAWLDFHRAAHRAGLQTTASFTFGLGESPEELVAGLGLIRTLQLETGAFAAIAPVSHHAPNGRDLDDPTAVEFLKTLAVTRMFLENIPNVQTGWQPQGLKVLQMALRFGANDVGAIDAAHPGLGTEEELRRLIRDAGFRPAQRDSTFRSLLLT